MLTWIMDYNISTLELTKDDSVYRYIDQSSGEAGFEIIADKYWDAKNNAWGAKEDT